MKIVNMKDLEVVKGCGRLKELYSSKNLNLAYTIIEEGFKEHKHEKKEEVYFVVKGKGKIKIGDEIADIKEGDVVEIPIGKYHSIISVEETIELMAVTHPGHDESDVFYWLLYFSWTSKNNLCAIVSGCPWDSCSYNVSLPKHNLNL